MGPDERRITSVADSVAILRRQFGIGARDHVTTLVDRWPELAGADVAGRSTVIDLRNGTITVETPDPAVAEVLGWSKQRVLAAAREACPGERIVDLTVRVRSPRTRAEG